MATGILDCQIEFTLGTRKLVCDYGNVQFTAWGELKRTTGFTQKTLLQALAEVDLDATAALIWLERKQRERKVRIDDVYDAMQSSQDKILITQITIDGKDYLDGDSDEDDEDVAAAVDDEDDADPVAPMGPTVES